VGQQYELRCMERSLDCNCIFCCRCPGRLSRASIAHAQVQG